VAGDDTRWSTSGTAPVTQGPAADSELGTGSGLAPEEEPEPGPDGQLASGPPGQPVTWSFPVEIVVVGEVSEEHLLTVAAFVFEELDTALRGIG
jgi:hypothetical protein